jgi:hypothetical protein
MRFNIRQGIVTGLVAGATVATLHLPATASDGPPNEGGRTPAASSFPAPTGQLKSVRGQWGTIKKASRNILITGGGDVPLPKCGPAAQDCYVFQAVLTDKGTFTGKAGAFTPNQFRAGLRITGSPAGTYTGTSTIIFYASGYPYRNEVGMTGPQDTAHLYKKFFGSGTRFDQNPGFSESFTFKACGQTWHVGGSWDKGQDKSAGNITGATC